MTPEWHYILLAIIPVLISAFVKPDTHPRVKYGITIFLCVLASIAEFYFAVWLTGGVQTTFLMAFAKSFLVIFATYAGVMKFPIPGPTIAARLESAGEVQLPPEVTAVLEAETAAAKKEAQVVQVMSEASKAQEGVKVAEAASEASKAQDGVKEIA